jgi:hypothetical protein
LRFSRRHLNSSCRIARSCTSIDQSNCVFHCSYYIILKTFFSSIPFSNDPWCNNLNLYAGTNFQCTRRKWGK